MPIISDERPLAEALNEINRLRHQLALTRAWAEDEQGKRIKAEEDRTDARSQLAEAREMIKYHAESPFSDRVRCNEWLRANEEASNP